MDNSPTMEMWLMAASWQVIRQVKESGAPAYACVGVVVDNASRIPDEEIGEGLVGTNGLAWHEAVRAFSERRPDLLPLLREMPRGNRCLCVVSIGGEETFAVMNLPAARSPNHEVAL